MCNHLVGRHHVTVIVGRDHNSLAVLSRACGRQGRAREHGAWWVERPRRWRRRPRWQGRAVGWVGKRGWRRWWGGALLVEAHLAAVMLVEERAIVLVVSPVELIGAEPKGYIGVDGHARERDVVIDRDACTAAFLIVTGDGTRARSHEELPAVTTTAVVHAVPQARLLDRLFRELVGDPVHLIGARLRKVAALRGRARVPDHLGCRADLHRRVLRLVVPVEVVHLAQVWR